MFRGSLLAVGILLGTALAARAAEVEGTVTAVDQAKRTLTVKVGDEETKYELTPGCKVYIKVRTGRTIGYTEKKEGLKAVLVGVTVNLETDFQDGKDLTTRVKIETGASRARRRNNKDRGRRRSARSSLLGAAQRHKRPRRCRGGEHDFQHDLQPTE